MNKIVVVILLTALCSAQNYEILLHDFFNNLKFTETEALLRCANNQILKEWESAVNFFKSIKYWNETRNHFIGVSKLIQPMEKSILMVVECSDREVEDFLKRFKKAISNSESLIKTIKENGDMMSVIFPELINDWNENSYGEFGELAPL